MVDHGDFRMDEPMTTGLPTPATETAARLTVDAMMRTAKMLRDSIAEAGGRIDQPLTATELLRHNEQYVQDPVEHAIEVISRLTSDDPYDPYRTEPVVRSDQCSLAEWAAGVDQLIKDVRRYGG